MLHLGLCSTAVKAYVEKNLNSLKLNKNAKGYLSDLIKESDSKATNQREHVLSMFEQRYGAYVVDSITYNAQFTACYQVGRGGMCLQLTLTHAGANLPLVPDSLRVVHNHRAAR